MVLRAPTVVKCSFVSQRVRHDSGMMNKNVLHQTRPFFVVVRAFEHVTVLDCPSSCRTKQRCGRMGNRDRRACKGFQEIDCRDNGLKVDQPAGMPIVSSTGNRQFERNVFMTVVKLALPSWVAMVSLLGPLHPDVVITMRFRHWSSLAFIWRRE